MPTTIPFPKLICGISTNAAAEGEPCTVITAEFLSSEDGIELISRLEQVAGLFLPSLNVRPSQVDHLLAVISRDGSATVYCNELSLVMGCQSRRPVQAGALTTLDDIADVRELHLHDREGKSVNMPPDHALVFILSHGWRRGLYYDFGPFNSESTTLPDNLPRLFGQFMAHLMFQELTSATEAQWARLAEWGLFPFVGLSHSDRVDLVNISSFDRDPTPFVEPMCRRFGETLNAQRASWRESGLFNSHMDFIDNAAGLYDAGNYVACLSTLMPRIEGVLRELYVAANPGARAGQKDMSSHLTGRRPNGSALLPHRFDQFLRSVYFRAFDLEAGDLALSRNSHGHGVSRAADYNLVTATVGFLTLDQIWYYLRD